MNRVEIRRKVLAENDRVAARLRARCSEHNVLCLNLISSPGAGKTALLERTLENLPFDEKVGVLVGDIQTDNDARRLARFGFPVRQISTGGGCHLDAHMVEQALDGFGLDGSGLDGLDVLFIENVGNLVCPSSYDLGEAAKIVLLSVAEGDDKPLKYPAIFLRADLLILNKIDLLPYVPFDLETARRNALTVNPQLDIIEVSCTTGTGVAEWAQWIDKRRRSLRPEVAASMA